ncbi:hypothetical protein L210DRAFT_932002 [Boletus edulis BED1]|uniref:Uncharacterized protein n=1 Tax=Boletus edulis BED1 TaxID=1328754 RepID=A0AAD4GEE9_BOLED|nr:hypothetical protein L210DRAFT_932002 [Boletus edulis BED1]
MPLSFHTSTSFKDALKYGFYEFQNIHGWYCEVIADIGMHADLALGLRYTPPNTSGSFLHEPQSIQLMHWPGPGCTADHTLIETSTYMQTPKRKPDSLSFDPKLPKSVWVYVVMWFHSLSGKRRVQAVREAYSKAQDKSVVLQVASPDKNMVNAEVFLSMKHCGGTNWVSHTVHIQLLQLKNGSYDEGKLQQM